MWRVWLCLLRKPLSISAARENSVTMLTTAVSEWMRIGSVGNGSVATSSAGPIWSIRRYGRTCASCSPILSESAASSRAVHAAFVRKREDRLNNLAFDRECSARDYSFDDAYQEGFLERDEFEPRIRVAKERLAKLETEAKAVADRESEAQDPQTAIGQLGSFGSRIQEGLKDADWATRREILRSLIRKVEIGHDAIRIEYKVGPLPFDRGPNRAESQHCWGLIQPLLANLFLHYVLDEWFEEEVRPRLKGQAFLIRYADDFVIGVARSPRRRRPANHGGLAQTDEQVRADGPPGEDAIGAVSTTPTV